VCDTRVQIRQNRLKNGRIRATWFFGQAARLLNGVAAADAKQQFIGVDPRLSAARK
jgi:hypothetical protein